MSRRMLVPARWAVPVLSIAWMLATAACGDDDGQEPDDHEHSHETCGLQEHCGPDTVELEEGLRVESEDGAFTVEVLSHAPLSIDHNEIIVAIENADGDRVTDADLEVDVFSLDCLHGGPNPPASIGANDDGNYELAPEHEHGGPWDTVIEIDAEGETDTARLHFCVPGADHDDAGAGEH